MTKEEALTIETMAGMAARRLKVLRSVAGYGRENSYYPITIHDIDHVNDLIGAFDALREEYPR